MDSRLPTRAQEALSDADWHGETVEIAVSVGLIDPTQFGKRDRAFVAALTGR